MFAGNPDESNSMVASFRFEMKGELDRLHTEIFTIVNAKDALQKSLDLLEEISRALKLNEMSRA
jgi:hypothetical protein